jgi:hypothetical protein
MNHPMHRVTAFEIAGPYAIHLWFEDGLDRTIDFSSILAGELFGPLQDPSVFKQAKLDPEAHTLVWPNGADFDPATLHDWPQHAEAFAAQAKQWQLAPT